MAKARQKKKGRRSRRPQRVRMLFDKRNYQLMVLGVVLVAIGFAMMRLENEVDGFISLYIAPLLILGGYLEIIYAIMYRPKESSSEKSG
ncbi:MAG: DUF3098 domain-containing protein [Rhodothermales bacterium]|nr:DUF3098 domain-containing protein [Rhodothermales bacterium]